MDALRRHGFFALAALLGLGAIGLSTGASSAWAIVPALAAGLAVCAGAVLRDARAGTLITALYGAACSFYLLAQKLDTSGGKAICSIDAVFDCGKVNTSAYSEVAGVPITLIGGAYYVGLAFAAWRASPDARESGPFHQLNAVLALVGVAYSIFLGWITSTLGAVCVVCITMYGANALLLWAGFRGLAASSRGLTENLGALFGSPPFKELAGTALLVLVLGSFAGSGEDPGAPPRAGNGKPNWSALYFKAEDVEITGDEPIEGSRDARYEIVEFADFGCPHCARAKKELDELIKLRRDVSVRFKPFALSGACNPSLEDASSGLERCDAARAAICAHRQGRFWEMAELLFTNQGYFEPAQIRTMAEQAGLDLAAWEACMVDPTSLEAVKAAGKAGGDLGIRGTPALFVRGLFGPRWVEVTGVPAVLKLLEAVDQGEQLTPPP